MSGATRTPRKLSRAAHRLVVLAAATLGPTVWSCA